MFRLIADSKIELFLEKDRQFANLMVLRILRYRIISFTSQLKGHTTTYWGGSLVEKNHNPCIFGHCQFECFIYPMRRHDIFLVTKNLHNI